MAIDVRPAVVDDEGPLAAIDRATWSPEVSPGPEPDADRLFFMPPTDPRDVHVAVVDQVVAGYVRVGSPTPLESNRHVLMITGLAVDPAFRRRGVGRALVAAAVRAATARGARRLTLRVLESNPGALRLYEQCDFVVEGVLRQEFLLGDGYVDDVLMARILVP